MNFEKYISKMTDIRCTNPSTTQSFIMRGKIRERSPVSIIPPNNEIIKDKKILPITTKYQDVKKNEVNFVGKITVQAESRGNRKNLSMLITEREDIKTLLGMDWLRQFNSMMRNIQSTTTITDQSEKDKEGTNFEKLFKTNRTTKDTEIKIQLKPRHPPIEQKTRSIPYHLQSYVQKNEWPNWNRTLRESTKKRRGFVRISVINNSEKDNSVKIALDSWKLKDGWTKLRTYMPNMEELFNQISTELTKVRNKPLWISKVDLEYVYGQLNYPTGQANNALLQYWNEIWTESTDLKKNSTVYPASRQNSQKKNRQNIELSNTRVAWWHNSSNKGGTKKIVQYTRETSRSRIESKWEKNQKFSTVKQIRPGHEITEHGIKPNKKKMKLFSRFKPPASSKEPKSFRKAIQNNAKLLPKLSEKPTQWDKYYARNRNGTGPEEQRETLANFKKNDKRNIMSDTIC